jgi:signal transduction histidine kinase
MTRLKAIAARLRRRLPQTVRFRLSVLYALLFLAAGALLLTVTYVLVDHTLPMPAQPVLSNAARVKAAQECLAASYKASAPAAKGTVPTKPAPRPKAPSAAQRAACQKAFAQGAAAAAVAQRDRTLHRLLEISLVGLGVMTLVSAIAGWVVAGRALRPVRAITEAARRASDRHLGERLDLQGPDDELKELADTFDEMLDRLDAAFASQRRFVADASHELRTPLTALRTTIEVTLAKPSPTPNQIQAMGAKVRAAVDQADALIEALLTLASSEREVTRPETIDLAEAATAAVAAAAEAAQLGDVRIGAELEPARVEGQRVLVERMVANLVDNAVRHNVAHGWVDVRTSVVDHRSVVRVSNSGPLVPEDLVPSLFEPFRRVEERTSLRPGVGLGLAIVRSIVTAHGADLSVSARADGGLDVCVTFPSEELSAAAGATPESATSSPDRGGSPTPEEPVREAPSEERPSSIGEQNVSRDLPIGGGGG